MKKLIFGLGILVAGLTCSVASANDYYYQGDCCGAPCDSCCYETGFDGFYIGGNLGVISQLALRNEDIVADTYHGRDFVSSDFTIGGQIGYDWNCGCSLLGLVFDWDWSNISHSHTNLTGDQLKLDLDWYLTIRGRAGITVCDCLFYLTAGAAAARFETKWNNTPNTLSYHKDENRWGWVGGAGIEYLLGCNWSVGADLLYMQFSHDKKTFGSVASLEASDSVWVGRLLLNYRFGDLLDCFCCR